MRLHPDVKAALERVGKLGLPPLRTMPVARAREAFGTILSTLAPPPIPVAHVAEHTIPGPAGEIPIRVYTPHGLGPFPVVAFFHGGGWALGSFDTHDSICRILTVSAGCVTVSVGYRLAPEHKFPAAPEDCYAALQWLCGEGCEALNFNGMHLAVAGDSAGGNLAAAMCLMARDRGGPAIAHQLLICPAIDAGLDTPSQSTFAAGHLPLTREDMAWFWGLYLNEREDALNPYACPVRASDLRFLPSATVLTAEYDPLRDEGESYAVRLREAGAQVTCRSYEGVTHGFLLLNPHLPQTQRAYELAANDLRNAMRH